MPTINSSTSISGAGLSISSSIPRTSDGVAAREVSLPVGHAGSLSTRTDDDTGTITMDSGGHGITTGMSVDVHWAGGVQYAVTVGTVSGTSVPIDTGSGDNLPAQDTAVIVTPRVQINADIDGDALTLIGMKPVFTSPSSTAQAHIEFQDAANDSIAEIDLTANATRVWDVAGGSANPFTGDPITKAFATNGSATEAATLQLLWGADSTPG